MTNERDLGSAVAIGVAIAALVLVGGLLQKAAAVVSQGLALLPN
jgi:hypothetical protein